MDDEEGNGRKSLTVHAVALVASGLIHAGSPVLARVRVALVDVVLTARPVESGWTQALEAAARVPAFALVLARRPVALAALVDVLLAEHAREPEPTTAGEIAHLVGHTRGPVPTWPLHARVRFVTVHA